MAYIQPDPSWLRAGFVPPPPAAARSAAPRPGAVATGYPGGGGYFGDLATFMARYGPQLKAMLGMGGTDPAYQPLTDAELQARASAYVQSQIGPLIDEINRSISARSAQGTAAIQSLTGQLADLQGQYGPRIGGAYDTAAKSIGALETGLANRLSGAGQTVANQTVGALQQAGQDTGGAANLANIGAGAANAGFAKGSASLAALAATKAAEQSYGAKLPGIAGMEGVQEGRNLQAQLNSELGTQLGGVRTQAADLGARILQQLQANETDKAGARTAQSDKVNNLLLNLFGGYENSKSNQAKIAAAQAIAGSRAAAKPPSSVSGPRGSRYAWTQDKQGNWSLQQVVAPQPVSAAAKAAKPPTSFAGPNGSRYAWVQNKDGTWSTRQVLAPQAKAAKQPSLTAAQSAKLSGTASVVAENAYKGFKVTDAKTGAVTNHPPLSYQDALDEMRKEGIPDAIAIPILGRFYKPGERGRPGRSPGYQPPQAGAVPSYGPTGQPTGGLFG